MALRFWSVLVVPADILLLSLLLVDKNLVSSAFSFLHSFDCCLSAVRVIISTLGSAISTLGGGAGGFAEALGSQL